jgi:hypothetical protein
MSYFTENSLKSRILGFFANILILLAILSCAKSDPVTGESKIPEPSVEKRAREFADKGGGIFGDINNKKPGGGSTSVDFATSNVLWRATLKSLDFLPLLNVDYAGGIILYDWYSEDLNSREQIKVTVRFLNNELRSDSIDVIVHKKNCESFENCRTIKLQNNFSNQLKDNILSVARLIRIEEAKKEKK